MENREAVRAFLKKQSTMALATVDEAGNPQAAPLFYISDDDLNLYWLSSTTSRHSLNLTTHKRVAATIYPTIWGWMEIRGLQIEGESGIVRDDVQREAILTRYRHKFNLPPDLNAIIEQSTLYSLRPTWIRWLDNSIAFGYKAEIVL